LEPKPLNPTLFSFSPITRGNVFIIQSINPFREAGELISNKSGVGRVIIVVVVIAILALSIAAIYVLTLPNQIPDAPAYVGADTHYDERTVSLSWSEADGNGLDVTSYKIYRGTFPGYETLLMDLGTVLSYDDTTVTSGETYYYEVSAVNKIGEGPKSIEIAVTISTLPSAPRELVANLEGDQVTLTWLPPENDGGSPIFVYSIFRSNISGDYGGTPLAMVSELYYVNVLLDTTGDRFYIVKASNSIGSSPASNEVSVYIGQVTPIIIMTYEKNAGAPTGNYTFTVVAVTANDIKWTDITPVISGPASAALNIPNGGNVGAGDPCWFTYVTP